MRAPPAGRWSPRCIGERQGIAKVGERRAGLRIDTTIEEVDVIGGAFAVERHHAPTEDKRAGLVGLVGADHPDDGADGETLRGSAHAVPEGGEPD